MEWYTCFWMCIVWFAVCDVIFKINIHVNSYVIFVLHDMHFLSSLIAAFMNIGKESGLFSLVPEVQWQ